MAIRLRGLTWDDPRGYGPVQRLQEKRLLGGVCETIAVTWDIQPLSGFESVPLEELAGHYDLLVIDHPHIGQAARSGCLLPIGQLDDEYVGVTRQSYFWEGQQWAVPIDAACHVCAFHRDNPGWWPPLTVAELIEAARDGLTIALPLAGVHALLALLALLASSGCPLEEGAALPPDEGLALAAWNLRRLQEAALPISLEWNPIQALTALAERQCSCLPITFGYEHYQQHGVRFTPIPRTDWQHGPRGVLGGTGVAVSATSQYPHAAIAYARMLGAREVQTAHWRNHGGQPAHRAAWDQLAADNHFYRDTYAAIDSAYLRPRFPGWNHFQSAGGKAVNRWLRQQRCKTQALCDELRHLYATARRGCQPH